MKKTAIIYDFDGTLAEGNIQEQSFIPNIGMTKEEFWKQVKIKTKENDSDEILNYMYLMITLAQKAKVSFSKQDLALHGSKAVLFNGLKDGSWFERINNYGVKLGLKIEHYILSSGIEEMINGCSIRNHFKSVYASKFIFENEQAVWPAVAVNYTTKNQYLFRINKGVDNHWDNQTINEYMPEGDRPIPFDRMIFIGDGDTDIPTMKMLTYKGGHSFAVYSPKKDHRDISKIHKLISDGRVEFVAPANYTENSQLDILLRGVLGRIARKNGFSGAL